MNMGGEKRIGTFPLTLSFAAPSRYYCNVFDKQRLDSNDLIDVEEKPKILKRF